MDKLNSVSYAYHYRNLDSTAYYAQKAITISIDANYRDGVAEAMNNLAFVDIVRMHYNDAQRLLDSIPEVTDNQLELLISYIQQMRLCQRQSRNRAFYDFREQALRALNRIDEDRSILNDHQQARLLYAESELCIVTSTYYYYVGLERQSAEELQKIPANVERDTAQYLNYLYNVGAGGIIMAPTQEEVNQIEFDNLMHCYLLAQQYGYAFYAANSLEALSEHLINPKYYERLVEDNMPSIKYLNTLPVPLEELPLWLAYQSLATFRDYGDTYQIAGACRTLASCYLNQKDYESALFNLNQSLSDTLINQAPDLVASIREQLSVAYAAIDDKAASDLNRNTYLDLQEQTRQDRQLEARAGQLDVAVSQLNLLLIAVVVAVLLLVILLIIFAYLHYHNRHHSHDTKNEEEDELDELLCVSQLHVEDGQRLALEYRSQVSLVNSITPFIDRILYEVEREIRPETFEYIVELIDKINEQNEVLTHWIQLRQGDLNLHIESFALQPLFDIVAKASTSFRLKGISLEVEPTDIRVKADRVLTLFMLNTLADNARKFTQDGGVVTISAKEEQDYVEVSVIDTGKGMSDEELSHVFEHKVSGEHGFGLLNCRGIIEKYHKVSQIFSVCKLDAESKKGQGSRFFFRLPKGVMRIFILLFGLGSVSPSYGSTDFIDVAKAYADSAYFNNLRYNFQDALSYADSCRMMLNKYFCQLYPDRTDTLRRMGDLSLPIPEVMWLNDSVKLNYDIILEMRNESAVAALALHEWEKYAYNNRIYTQLFKELSADATLNDYCRKMQQSQTNKTTAIIILIVLFIAILIAVILQIMNSFNRSARKQQERQERLDMKRDELRRSELEEANLHVSNAIVANSLSALKHETMYYPSRIRQLISSEKSEMLPEIVSYYRELYAILSEQAERQVERVKLHLSLLDHEILGDKVLIDYLFEILRRQSGQKELHVDYHFDGQQYVICEVAMHEVVTSSFMPTIENIPYLLCRQIVRDHGEATNRRACGIYAEKRDGQTFVIIKLPRQLCKTSKSSS